MAELRPTAPREPRGKLRRTLGCLVTGPLGCLAFFLGALLAVVLMTPNLLSPWLTRVFVEGFNHDRAGELQIGAIELRWFERQVLRNLTIRTPEGETVLRGSASAPSLVDLFGDELADFGRIEITVEELHLQVGEDGRTNLERALEMVVARDRRELNLDLQPLNTTPARYSVRVESLSWQDARTRRAGRPLEVQDVECSIEVLADGRAVVEIEGKEGMQLDVAFVWRAARNANERPFLDVERVRLAEIPSASLDALAGTRELFTRLLGPSFGLDGHAREGGEADDGVELTLVAERAEVRFRGSRAGGDLRSAGDGLVATLAWPEDLAAELLGAATARVGLARIDAEQPLVVSLTELVLPWSALTPSAPWRERLGGIRAELELGLGDWECKRPEGASPASGARLEGVRVRGSVASRAAGQPGAEGGPELEVRLSDARDQLVARLVTHDLSGIGAVLDGAELAGGATLELRALPAPAVARLFGSRTAVELAEDDVPLTLELVRARLSPPVAGGTTSGADRLEAEARVTLPHLGLRDPSRPGSELVISGLAGPLVLQPGARLRADLEGRVVDLVPGSARFSFVCGGPGRSAGTGATGGKNVVSELGWGLELEQVPARLADAWLGTASWIDALLGERLEGLELVYDRRPGELAQAGARMRSTRGELAVAGRIDAGRLVPGDGGAAQASFELTPTCAAHLIAWTVPLLVDVAAAPGGERAELRLRDFRLPLGAGGGLAANLELSLGPFTYGVLPGLAAKMRLAPELRAGRSARRTYRLRVEGGLARYDTQEIPIGPDHVLSFSGTQELDSGELNLTSRVPMALLVEGEEGLLEMLQGVLDEEDASPFIVVHGTYAEPSVLIDTYGLNDFVLGLGGRALRETIPAFLEARGRKE